MYAIRSYYEEKLSRIMDVKKRYFSEYNPLYIPDVKKEVGVAESKQFLKMITDRITSYNVCYTKLLRKSGTMSVLRL